MIQKSTSFHFSRNAELEKKKTNYLLIWNKNPKVVIKSTIKYVNYNKTGILQCKISLFVYTNFFTVRFLVGQRDGSLVESFKQRKRGNALKEKKQKTESGS